MSLKVFHHFVKGFNRLNPHNDLVDRRVAVVVQLLLNGSQTVSLLNGERRINRNRNELIILSFIKIINCFLVPTIAQIGIINGIKPGGGKNVRIQAIVRLQFIESVVCNRILSKVFCVHWGLPSASYSKLSPSTPQP